MVQLRLRNDVGETPSSVGGSGMMLGNPQARSGTPDRCWGIPRHGRGLRIDVGESPGSVGNSGSMLGNPQAWSGAPDWCWGIPRHGRELRIDVGESPGSVGDSGIWSGEISVISGRMDYEYSERARRDRRSDCAEILEWRTTSITNGHAEPRMATNTNQLWPPGLSSCR